MTLSPFLSEHEHCHNCRPPAEHTHQNDRGREISPIPVALGSLYDWIPSVSSRCYILQHSHLFSIDREFSDVKPKRPVLAVCGNEVLGSRKVHHLDHGMIYCGCPTGVRSLFRRQTAAALDFSILFLTLTITSTVSCTSWSTRWIPRK
jgi:hypothetical protein